MIPNLKKYGKMGGFHQTSIKNTGCLEFQVLNTLYETLTVPPETNSSSLKIDD